MKMIFSALTVMVFVLSFGIAFAGEKSETATIDESFQGTTMQDETAQEVVAETGESEFTGAAAGGLREDEAAKEADPGIDMSAEQGEPRGEIEGDEY